MRRLICPLCGEPIPADERRVRLTDGSWAHVRCTDADAARPRPLIVPPRQPDALAHTSAPRRKRGRR